MAQSLEEQIDVIERALGERMIEHALIIVRTWLTELGENNPYEEAFLSIQTRYQQLFSQWLSLNDDTADTQLNEMTGDTYQLVDAVYADIRLKRGLSPDMHGFNPDSHQSVMNYFENCVHWRQEDLEWFLRTARDEEHSAMALLATASIGRNLRECFSLEALQTLIEGMSVPNDTVAGQCAANVLILLIHYDVRIDFFPQIQESFVNMMASVEDGEDKVFRVLCALMESTCVEGASSDTIVKRLMEHFPEMHDETEYMTTLMAVLPNTWLYEVLVRGNEERERTLTYYGVKAGYFDMMWDYPDVAEDIFRNSLRERKDKAAPLEYIRYAHCLLLKGDRMMAYEYYKQARQLCKGPKDFFLLFRPDRRQLVDHGVPIEQVYLIEDQLIQN